jgi:hypothetical protein
VVKAAERVARANAKAAERAKAKAEAAAKPGRDAAGLGGRVRNTTDPDSRLMPVRSGGFAQAYNCQAGATRDSVLAAGLTTQEPNDVGQCQPMMDAIVAVVALFAQTRAAAGRACSCPLTGHAGHTLATPADPAARRRLAA